MMNCERVWLQPPARNREILLNKLLKWTVLILALAPAGLFLTSCANHRLSDHEGMAPALDLVQFFSGHVVAHGQIEDRFGKIRRRFAVDVVGTWDGEVLKLVEDFVYDDAATEQRIWKIKSDGNGGWIGQADGVIGSAHGKVVGNAMNWSYQFDLAMGDGKTMRVNFDDWLWLQAPDVLLNKAYISRFGIELAEVTIFFNRQTAIQQANAN